MISTIHKLEGKPPDQISSKSIVGVWKNIADSKKALSKHGLSFHQIFEGPSSQRNSWISKIDSDGRFSVAALRALIDQNPNLPSLRLIEWRKEVPMKVLCFAWRAMMGRIPTGEALSLRGCSVPSLVCSFCRTETENADHILVNCPLARNIWQWVVDWCGGDPLTVTSVGDILDYAKKWGRCPEKRSIFMGICYGVLWSLWIARNARVFNRCLYSASKIWDDIISLVFMWYKHRGKLRNLNWSLWCISPFDCM